MLSFTSKQKVVELVLFSSSVLTSIQSGLKWTKSNETIRVCQQTQLFTVTLCFVCLSKVLMFIIVYAVFPIRTVNSLSLLEVSHFADFSYTIYKTLRQ